MPIGIPAILGAGGGEQEYGLVLPVQVETIVWSWVIFLLLFLILRKFAWKPLLAAVEAREKKISDSLARAEEVQKAAAEIAQKQEAALAEAHAKAKTVLDEARVHAEDFRKRETEKARKESEEFLDTYERLFRERFDDAITSDFLGGAARRFLGFDDPANRNAVRLRKRYQRFAPKRYPGWLAGSGSG